MTQVVCCHYIYVPVANLTDVCLTLILVTS